MGLFRKRKVAISAEQEIQELGVKLAMIDSGWTPYPPDAPEEERQAALSHLLAGQAEWYPPGYQAEPVITEGKLIPEPEDA